MSKFFDRLDRISNLMGGTDSPDIKLEDKAKWAGNLITEPGWYIFLLRNLRKIATIAAFAIVGIVYILTKSTTYASWDGIKAILYLLLPALGLLLMPLKAVAYVQKKRKFRDGLPPEKQAIYTAAIIKKIHDFSILFVVILIVTVAWVGIIIYFARR